MTSAVSDDLFDSEADATILRCLSLSKPQSFFLYAGAGSGKTRSLVEAVRKACEEQGHRLSMLGRKIGIITYTNAACEVIQQRLEFDSRVEVSTIHSFAWSLISGFDEDIRKWLAGRLLQDVAELEQQQAKGRSNSKAAMDRARSIESKNDRRAGLGSIQRFIYSPTGENRTRDALSHAEVILITADFLTQKAGLRRLLFTRFPILLIDESQDTNRSLMDALLHVQAGNPERFCLGLFGDTMQRIYADGKEGLAEAIPESWARPRKAMNHRCPTRVIELINAVRKDADGWEQRFRGDAESGCIRFFVVPEDTADKLDAEARVCRRMAEVTGDDAWSADPESVKTLALEHLMSARRFGFQRFFEPLYRIESIKTGLLNGDGAGIGLFTHEILPLITALREGNRFQVATIIRRSSPLLDKKRLEKAGRAQKELLQTSKAACDGLLGLVRGNETVSLRTLLQYVAKTELFLIPDVLVPFVDEDQPEVMPDTSGTDGQAIEEGKTEIGAWRKALEAPFAEIEPYDRYVRGLSRFDTHQGVKGREFPRVMVIISDEEARGFLFAFDKLFGVKEKTKSDIENESNGKETSIDRTRRLFYVICSRAEKSLAIVYYAADPASVKAAIDQKGWFTEAEVEVFE